jgi:preprotein translocase subunit SecY
MKKVLETLYNIYKIEELRDRVLLTLGMLLVYRLGAQVVLPGIDPVQLAALSSRTDGGGLLGILNAFTGGAFANASVFALGYYALYFSLNCSSIDGYCCALPSKTSERR